MTEELKNKWLEALSSGKFVKGKLHLYFDGQYCCLGVLAEVCGLNINEIKHQPRIGETAELLSEAVLEKIGLSDIDQAHLAYLNDLSDEFETKVIPWIKENL